MAAVTKVEKRSNRGAKPGERRGGRAKGVKNKKNADLIKAIEESGVTPLKYMLDIMRQVIPDDVEAAIKVAMIGQRFEAAKAAAPYVHARLAAVELTGKDGAAVEHSIQVTFVPTPK